MECYVFFLWQYKLSYLTKKGIDVDAHAEHNVKNQGCDVDQALYNKWDASQSSKW